MRFLPAILSLMILAASSTAARADHFDEIEDAAKDYRKAVEKVHKELEREKYAPPYLAQLSHRLERAADHLEELADDERDPYRIDAAFHEVASLHARFSELAFGSPAFTGRHASRRLEEIHRRFDKLSREMSYLAAPDYRQHRDYRRGGDRHRDDYFRYDPRPVSPLGERRYESRRLDLHLEIDPRRSHRRDARSLRGLEHDLRHGHWERILPRLLN